MNYCMPKFGANPSSNCFAIKILIYLFTLLCLHQFCTYKLYIMCVHNPSCNDFSDKLPFDVNIYDNAVDCCDYMDVDNRLLVENTDLYIVQLNIHGLLSKLELLKKLQNESFAENYPDIILLCETWMNANSPKLSLPGYTMYETIR